ncbi:MAG: hypothetical protein LBU42_05270, partial [Prevotellaceae bacterium]|nr:hypothetical protein [Prevotellaceae bacterium]
PPRNSGESQEMSDNNKAVGQNFDQPLSILAHFLIENHFFKKKSDFFYYFCIKKPHNHDKKNLYFYLLLRFVVFARAGAGFAPAAIASHGAKTGE